MQSRVSFRECSSDGEYTLLKMLKLKSFNLNPQFCSNLFNASMWLLRGHHGALGAYNSWRSMEARKHTLSLGLLLNCRSQSQWKNCPIASHPSSRSVSNSIRIINYHDLLRNGRWLILLIDLSYLSIYYHGSSQYYHTWFFSRPTFDWYKIHHQVAMQKIFNFLVNWLSMV